MRCNRQTSGGQTEQQEAKQDGHIKGCGLQYTNAASKYCMILEENWELKTNRKLDDNHEDEDDHWSRWWRGWSGKWTEGYRGRTGTRASMKVFVSVCPPYNLCFPANCVFPTSIQFVLHTVPIHLGLYWHCTRKPHAASTFHTDAVEVFAPELNNSVNVFVQSYIVESIFAIVQDGFFATSDQSHKSVNTLMH